MELRRRTSCSLPASNRSLSRIANETWRPLSWARGPALKGMVNTCPSGSAQKTSLVLRQNRTIMMAIPARWKIQGAMSGHRFWATFGASSAASNELWYFLALWKFVASTCAVLSSEDLDASEPSERRVISACGVLPGEDSTGADLTSLDFSDCDMI